MADRPPHIALVTNEDRPSLATLSVGELEGALVAASTVRANALLARLVDDAEEARTLSALTFLAPGDRDRFRRIALILNAEIAGLRAARLSAVLAATR